jgi:MoxR-like ATPase
MEGTYPLPEAQLDRFMFNVVHGLPARKRRGGGAYRTAAGGRHAIEPPLHR